MIAKARLQEMMRDVEAFVHAPSGWVTDETEERSFSFQDNLNYVLGLFHLKERESLEKARELLHRLLSYGQEGVFPNSLLDFPHSWDQLSGVRALIPLTKIYRLYRSILGPALASHLHRQIQLAYRKGCAFLEQHQLRGYSQLEVASHLAYSQDLMQDKEQKELPEDFFQFDFSSVNITKLLLAELWTLQQVSSISFPFKKELDKLLESMWHPQLGYIGPFQSEPFDGDMPRQGLFEATFNYSGISSLRQLKAIWAYPHMWEVPEHLKNQKRVAVCYAEQQLAEKEVPSKHRYPLVCTWLEERQAFMTLRCPTGDVSLVHQEGGTYTFQLSFAREYDRKKDEEIEILITKLPGLQLHFDGVKATCFPLGEVVHITSACMEASLSFTHLSGEGTWMGHISQALRESRNLADPSQVHPEWKVALRTVRRKPKASIEMRLHFAPIS